LDQRSGNIIENKGPFLDAPTIFMKTKGIAHYATMLMKIREISKSKNPMPRYYRKQSMLSRNATMFMKTK
jgi:hypothetical protein